LTIDRNQTPANQDQTLRVCFISHQYPPGIIGGIGRFTADLASGFAAAGHDVHVVSSQGGVCGATLEDGVLVHRLPGHPALSEAMKQERAGHFLSRLGAVYREVVRLHEEKPFDIVSSPIWLAEGLLVAMDPRFVSILSLHTSSKSGLDSVGVGDPLAILEMRCVGAHSHTHANSNAAVKKITAEYCAPNGVVIIPHGVNDMSPRYPRARHDDGRVRVLVVGLLDKRKGADVLYDLIPKILSRFSAVEFVLAGPAYPMAEFRHKTLPAAMKARFSTRPEILQRVTFAGVVSDQELYRFYTDADLLLLPSRYESFGLSVIEAMSFGLPVVAWKAGGVCETVIDGETGILVDVEDRNGLIEAVGRFAADPDLRRRYGESGRKRYLLNFSTAISIPRTIAAYRKILETSRASSEAHHACRHDTLVSRFTAVIERTTALKGESARHAARLLIDGDSSGQPRVGIIIRCFNSAAHVTAALDSVLAQIHPNFVCVVVDDASSDHSAEVVANWIADKQDGRFSLVRNRVNRGQMASAAIGLAACEGELVAFLDADDIWIPEFLQIHVSVIHRTSIAVSCSDRLIERQIWTGASETSRGPPPVRVVPPSYLKCPCSAGSSMMVRRSVLEAVIPADADSLGICAHEYILTICHYISGSFVIDRPLMASQGDKEPSPFTVPESCSAPRSAAKQDDRLVVVRALLRHLLDYPPKLASLLPARRRDILVRSLVRRCLLAGIAVEDPRVYRVLGSSRILRDRLRAKVWFLRRGLD
jgi:glycosyltransferase involved in cell wall biosynthesis